MKLSNLAAKQKRARSWQEFIDAGETSDKLVVAETRDLLVEFRATLSEAAHHGAANNGNVSPELDAKIIDLERRLEQLNEEARLKVGP